MKREECDVLVIGSGGAGLRCAIELKDKGVNVLVVGKCAKRDAHTILATGGINASFGNMDKEDSWQLHAADTIKDGEHINDPVAVEILCKDSVRTVKELAGWGAKFHREKDGRITQRFFGAATYRRACFSGDHTGKEILNTLVDQVVARDIRFKSEFYITDLLKNKKDVNGAIGIDIKSGELIAIKAKAVVICTGGYSRIFKRSSSRIFEANGDGIYLAYQAGSNFIDMEMFQFHPTGMVYPKKAEGILVTEAVRGEGGILLNSKGERFMKNYDPERMELSARDIVARANYNEIKNGRGSQHNAVWLDITHKPKNYILKRLPKMYKQFKEYTGIDISKERMQVAPTAHYSMGGIKVDYATGKTNIPNLYAIGEATGGLHGGNRLGGNSLLGILVFGRLTGQSIAKDLRNIANTPVDEKDLEEKAAKLKSMLNQKGEDPIKIKAKLQEIMWQYAGVVRNKKDLIKGLKELNKLKVKLNCGMTFKMNEKLIAALDLRAMIKTSEMVIQSALYRKESRGAHYRSDYPKVSSKWKKNVICTPTNKGVKITTQSIKPVNKEIKKFLTQRKAIAHLLE